MSDGMAVLTFTLAVWAAIGLLVLAFIGALHLLGVCA